MGACTDYRVFNHNDKSKIKLEWDAEVEQSRRDDGNQYSGQIGMHGPIGGWKDLKFSTQEQAGEWLFDNHDKWEDALAVSFLLEAKKDNKVQRKLDGLQEKVVKVNEKSREYIERSQKNFFDSSIKFATCKSCESKLRRELLYSKFKLDTVNTKMTLQKITNRSVDLYLKDNKYKHKNHYSFN